ncbi:LysR substrate-binding domain-containing protein [Pseudomonas fluorescens]|nr:LysR family transcriptional regulator [Pseudomonas fluorescens]
MARLVLGNTMNQLLAMRTLVRVVESGSFSKAADHLGLPRSTVSKLISDLELYLGIKLVHRTTRSLAVTQEGYEYATRAREVLGGLDALDSSIRKTSDRPGGHLRVDAPTSFANRLLIPALPDFNRLYPDISIALGVSDRTIDIIGEGVDCVIRAGVLADIPFIARKIFTLDYVTCASPSYLEQNGVPESPAMLESGHRGVGYFSAATGKVEPLIFHRDIERYEITKHHYSANEGNGHIELLKAGFGVGQNLKRFMEATLQAGELVTVLDDWTRPSVPFHIIYPPSHHKKARLGVFIEWLVERFPTL